MGVRIRDTFKSNCKLQLISLARHTSGFLEHDPILGLYGGALEVDHTDRALVK